MLYNVLVVVPALNGGHSDIAIMIRIRILSLSLIVTTLIERCFSNHLIRTVNYENFTSNVFDLSLDDFDGIINLNAFVLHKSILNLAESSARMLSISQKLDAQRCLTFTVLGGSVSCGDGVSKRYPQRECRGKPGSWPTFFEKHINERFPCSSHGKNSHEVQNLCEIAKGSEHWIRLLTRRKDTEFWTIVNRTNIFLIDASLNDPFGDGYVLGVPNSNRTMMQTEILTRLILSLEKKPTLLFLGASSQGHCDDPDDSRGCLDWGWEGRTRTDAVPHQLPIAKYYNVPFVSMIDAFGPFFSRELLDFWVNVCKIDRRHLTVLGSKALAALAVNFFEVHVHSVRRPLFSGQPSVHDDLPPLLTLDERTFSMYASSAAIEVNPVSGYCRAHRSHCGFQMESASFEVREDVPGKPGLIAQQVGDFVDFFLTPQLLSKGGGSFGLLRMPVLMSYQQMGTFRVSLRRETAIPTGCLIDDLSSKKSFSLLLANATVDCLWDRQVSVAQAVELPFDPASLRENKHCLRVRIEIVDSQPRRTSNKIKLFGFDIFI